MVTPISVANKILLVCYGCVSTVASLWQVRINKVKKGDRQKQLSNGKAGTNCKAARQWHTERHYQQNMAEVKQLDSSKTTCQWQGIMREAMQHKRQLWVCSSTTMARQMTYHEIVRKMWDDRAQDEQQIVQSFEQPTVITLSQRAHTTHRTYQIYTLSNNVLET